MKQKLTKCKCIYTSCYFETWIWKAIEADCVIIGIAPMDAHRGGMFSFVVVKDEILKQTSSTLTNPSPQSASVFFK